MNRQNRPFKFLALCVLGVWLTILLAIGGTWATQRAYAQADAPPPLRPSKRPRAIRPYAPLRK